MRKKLSIPFGETTILSFLSTTIGAKFQLIAKVKNIKKSKITLTDDLEDLDLDIEEEELVDIKVGDIVVVFGEKIDSGIKNEHISKLNLDWELYCKTREIELR